MPEKPLPPTIPGVDYQLPCRRADHVAGSLAGFLMPWSGTLLRTMEPVAVRVEHRGGATSILAAGTLVEDVGRSWDPLLDWASDHLYVHGGDLAGECVATAEWPANDDDLPLGFAPARTARTVAVPRPGVTPRWAGIRVVGGPGRRGDADAGWCLEEREVAAVR